MANHDCVYVTSGWGIHDERWIAGMRSLGWAPLSISVGRDVVDESDLRRAVTEAAASSRPVLAGPLNSVTRALVGLPVRLVGLSWGFDLDELTNDGTDLSWLAELSGLVVDSANNRAIAIRNGLDAEKITFLPWGIDLSVFTMEGPRMTAADFDLPGESRIVLSLRAHEPRYRVGDILEAFARSSTKDIALVVGHAGSMTQRLRTDCVRLGIAERTRFIGTVPEDQLPSLLRSAACYITASEVDGTSVTLLEAMACGTPVIASDTPGNLGWTQDKVTALTFPTGNVDRLTQVMQNVIDDHPADVVLRARALVERDADWFGNLPRLQAILESAART